MWLERLLPDLACSVSGFRPARRRITVERPRRALAVQANESALRRVDGQDGSRHEGTGLGLAIVKKSLALLGGEIEVESEVGKGSCFAIRLRDYAGGGA